MSIHWTKVLSNICMDLNGRNFFFIHLRPVVLCHTWLFFFFSPCICNFPITGLLLCCFDCRASLVGSKQSSLQKKNGANLAGWHWPMFLMFFPLVVLACFGPDNCSMHKFLTTRHRSRNDKQFLLTRFGCISFIDGKKGAGVWIQTLFCIKRAVVRSTCSTVSARVLLQKNEGDPN